MRIPPLTLAAGAALAQLPLLHRPRRSSALCAAPVLVASVGLWQGAVLAMRKRGTTLDPEHVDHAEHLVTTGPFAVSRNPVYAGIVGVLAGVAVLGRSPLALAPPLAFALVLDRGQIPAEEEALSANFPEYAEYRRRVRRWI